MQRPPSNVLRPLTAPPFPAGGCTSVCIHCALISCAVFIYFISLYVSNKQYGIYSGSRHTCQTHNRLPATPSTSHPPTTHPPTTQPVTRRRFLILIARPFLIPIPRVPPRRYAAPASSRRRATSGPPTTRYLPAWWRRY